MAFFILKTSKLAKRPIAKNLYKSRLCIQAVSKSLKTTLYPLHLPVFKPSPSIKKQPSIPTTTLFTEAPAQKEFRYPIPSPLNIDIQPKLSSSTLTPKNIHKRIIHRKKNNAVQHYKSLIDTLELTKDTEASTDTIKAIDHFYKHTITPIFPKFSSQNNHTNYQWEARLNNISFSTYKDTIQKDIDSESFRSNTNYDTYESQLNTLNHKLDSLKLNHYSKQRTETSSETSDEIPGKHPNKKHVTTTRLSPTQKEQARKIAMASKGAKKPISSPKKQIKTQPDRDDQYWENIEFLIECRRENHYLS